MTHIAEILRIYQSYMHMKSLSLTCIKDCEPLDFLGDFTRHKLGRSTFFIHMWSRVTDSLITTNVDVRQKHTLHDIHGLKPRLSTFKWVENVMWSGLYDIGRTSLF